MKKNTRLSKLLSESPCNVIFGIDKTSPLFLPDSGAYYSHKLNKIILHSDWDKNYEKYSVLAHEITHAICAKNRCFCDRSKYLCEYHAFKDQIIRCLEYPKALKYSLLWIADMARGRAQVPTISHRLACKNLTKTKLFKLAMKLSKKTKVVFPKNSDIP